MITLMKIFLYILMLFGFQKIIYADNYNFYFAQGADDDDGDGVPNTDEQTVKIINTSTYTVYDGTLTGYYALEYDDLAATITNGVTGSSYSASLDYMGSVGFNLPAERIDEILAEVRKNQGEGEGET